MFSGPAFLLTLIWFLPIEQCRGRVVNIYGISIKNFPRINGISHPIYSIDVKPDVLFS